MVQQSFPELEVIFSSGHLSLSLALMLSFQVVTSRWSVGLPTYLASSLEIAVLEVKTLHGPKVLRQGILKLVVK